MARPYLTIDHALLRSRAFLEFGDGPEFRTWLMLRARIARSLAGPLAAFYLEGWLACLVSVRQLEGEWQGLRSRGTVAEDVRALEELGLIDTYPAPTGLRGTLVHLGWCGCVARDGQSVLGPIPACLDHLHRRALDPRSDHRSPAGITRWESLFADRVLAEAEPPADEAEGTDPIASDGDG